MKKVFQIGWKDLMIIYRDRAALLLMLAAPLALTVALGLVTGSFNTDDGPAGIGTIPLVVVNQDEGDLGEGLLEILEGEDLASLMEVTTLDDEAEARARVDGDEATAAVVVPAGFSAGIVPDMETGETAETVEIEVYANPTRPIGVGVVESIVDGFVKQVQGDVAAIDLIITQLVESGHLQPEQIPPVADALAQDFAPADQESRPQLISLASESTTESADDSFNPLTMLAPGMAVFFLIYGVTTGARNILTEWEEGTLRRVMTTPTRITEVLGGKMLGIFLTAVLQLAILILASTLLFQLDWGSPLPLSLLIVAVAAAATGWGLLLAAVSKTSTQVASLGSAMMLVFGILGGGLVTISFTGIMNIISHLTPNAWATDGFTLLANGGTLQDILPIIGALLLMTAVLFGTATFSFRRRWG